MAENSIKLSDEVMRLLKQRAAADGVSVEEAAAEAVKIGLEEGRWRSLLARGQRYGRESGYTEEDVEALVQGFRNENRGR
jgi:plasmid stability protein